MKKKQTQVLSSDETDSDASSSSSEGEGLPLAPLQSPESDGSKLKKPRSTPNSKPSNPAASPIKTPAKRALALDGEGSKRPRKEKGDGVGSEEEEGKKSAPFRRLWSEDDEIVVLKGILEYKEAGGADPVADPLGFYNFIKKPLHLKVDRRQVMDKIRKLKMRYTNNLSNKKKNDQSAFELSKKIWGNDAEAAELDQQSIIKTRRLSKTEDANEKKEAENNDSEMNKEGISLQFVGQSSISMGLDENIVKVGLGLCSDVKKAEMEEKWKQFYLEESKLFLRKLDLAREESNMIREALKSEGK